MVDVGRRSLGFYSHRIYSDDSGERHQKGKVLDLFSRNDLPLGVFLNPTIVGWFS